VRVLVVEDHAIVREGFCLLLDAQPDLEVVGQAADGRQAVELVAELAPDVVVMDLALPDVDGIEATRRIKDLAPGTQVVALTMHVEDEFFFPALEAGASGYVVKGATSEDLLQAIRAAAKGETYLQSAVAGKLVADYVRRVQAGEEATGIQTLSPREREVLTLIAQGYSNRQIAEQLVISLSTVQTHCSRIMRKLELDNRAGLIAYGIRHGLIIQN
jgi:two-component system response regulator NreC